jgi:UDP-N-acetylmuramoylalanine--D-glutamate ligase
MTPDWRGLPVVVAGAGRTGDSIVRALEPLGAVLTVVDDKDGSATALPEGTALVVTSPGFAPHHPLMRSAATAGVPVWGDVELAWRLSRDTGTEWLVVTGTNGKTTTTEMLGAMLREGGRHASTAGNIGTPILDVVRSVPPYEVLAVEMSSFQLHWAPSVAAVAAVVLNIADDHLDWHGSRVAYEKAKANAFAEGTIAVGVADDPASMRLLAHAPGRRVVVRLGPPGPGELGVVVESDGGDVLLVDRAFGPGAPERAELLLDLGDAPVLAAPHLVTDALAAAALARAAGVPGEAIAAALTSFRPGAHRVQLVGERDGVRFVDDSKATNPHAALASLSGFDPVVWIAGGRNKGLSFDDLVSAAAPRLRAAVLLGESADEIADAFARHAPQITLVRASTLDDGVREAASLAHPGDTVLLAPAAASMDMFRDYAERGDVFAAAVRTLLER